MKLQTRRENGIRLSNKIGYVYKSDISESVEDFEILFRIFEIDLMRLEKFQKLFFVINRDPKFIRFF